MIRCFVRILDVTRFFISNISTWLQTCTNVAQEHFTLDALPDSTIILRESNTGPLIWKTHYSTATPTPVVYLYMYKNSVTTMRQSVINGGRRIVCYYRIFLFDVWILSTHSLREHNCLLNSRVAKDKTVNYDIYRHRSGKVWEPSIFNYSLISRP